MDLEQALQLIDRVLSNVQGSRQDHMAINQAFSVVVEAARANTPEPAAVPDSNGKGEVVEIR